LTTTCNDFHTAAQTPQGLSHLCKLGQSSQTLAQPAREQLRCGVVKVRLLGAGLQDIQQDKQLLSVVNPVLSISNMHRHSVRGTDQIEDIATANLPSSLR
jgi:hypothetical protein